MSLEIGAILVASAAPLGCCAWAAAGRFVPERARPPLGAVIAAAMAMAASASLWPRTGLSLASLGLGWTLLTMAVVDLAALRLPDRLTLPLMGAGLLLAATGLEDLRPRPSLQVGAAIDHALGAALGYGAFAGLAALYRRLRGREGLGLGDAKLAACAGAWLGWRVLPLVVLTACALAFIWVGAKWALSGRRALEEPLAFGVPLAVAIWILWLAGPAAFD